MQKTFCSLSFWKKDCAAPKVSAWCAARRAQHAAGNFNNRHVEIVGAAQIRVNVRIFYRPLTAPTGLGLLTTQGPRGGGSSRSSSAWLGRSQKDGLPSLPPSLTDGSRPSTRAGRGSLVAAPLLTTDLSRPPRWRSSTSLPPFVRQYIPAKHILGLTSPRSEPPHGKARAGVFYPNG
jgi:hypothetical protein